MAERESAYLWSTTALTNGAVDPAINFAEGQLPGTLNNSNRAKMAADARLLKDTNGSLTTGGSANAYTLTVNSTITAYASGHRFSFKANHTNTGAATLNITNADATAIGAKAIRGHGDVALTAGQIVSGSKYDVSYDPAANSAAGAFILMNQSIGVLPEANGGTGLSAAIYGAFYKSTDQAYTSGSNAKVLINTAELNQGLTFDSATSNRVTIITTGKYHVDFGVHISGLTFGDLVTGRIKKNGTTDVAISFTTAANPLGKEASATASKVVALTANDYIELWAGASGSGTINGLPTTTYMSLHRVGT